MYRARASEMRIRQPPLHGASSAVGSANQSCCSRVTAFQTMMIVNALVMQT